MSQMENILFILGKIDPKFRLYIKKISRKATSLSKSHLGKKLRVGQEDKNDKQLFYEVRVRGVIIVEFTIMESFVVWSL